MDDERRFYRVSRDPYDAPLRDFLLHGFSDRLSFLHAVRRLTERWHDRVGEKTGERNGFFLLRFHDTPGGKPDEDWIPEYLLKETDVPKGYGSHHVTSSSEETETAINTLFEF